VSKYHRLHSTSCTTEPAAIVDHFAGSAARRLRFGWKHKHLIMSGLPYNVSLYGFAFFLRKWFFFSLMCNILWASGGFDQDPTGEPLPLDPAAPSSPPGSLPLSLPNQNPGSGAVGRYTTVMFEMTSTVLALLSLTFTQYKC